MAAIRSTKAFPRKGGIPMSGWITHLMIADLILKEIPALDRHGFCVGSIAPDCNIENEDWTSFTPPREVTHWMRGEKKNSADYEAFFAEYIRRRLHASLADEELSFLLGYYAHLITDAAFDLYTRDSNRVAAVWRRLRENAELALLAEGLPETWDSVKKLILRKERMREMCALEAEYLHDNSSSGFLTEIVPLKEFPDYLGYMPEGCIARKVKIMGVVPPLDRSIVHPVSISREELLFFVQNTASAITQKLNNAFSAFRA
jgi:hypothetical protein